MKIWNVVYVVTIVVPNISSAVPHRSYTGRLEYKEYPSNQDIKDIEKMVEGDDADGRTVLASVVNIFSTEDY